MKFWICLLLAMPLLIAAPKKKPADAPVCVDAPRVAARKRPVKKVDLNEASLSQLGDVKFGMSLDEKLNLSIDIQASSDEGAAQMEKMAGALAASAPEGVSADGKVVINLPKATRVSREGKLIRTTVSLSDEQLDKLLEARYGRKMAADIKAGLVYVHGLPGGTKTYPWGDGVVVNLRK